MAKDRNTFAKQQREVEKRRKAAAKRDRRDKRKQEPQGRDGAEGDAGEQTQPQAE